MRFTAIVSILVLFVALAAPALSAPAISCPKNQVGEVRITDSFAVKESFDLGKGRMVSAYKGSFIIRENFYRPEFHALHEFFKYILVPVPGTDIYPLKSVESFCEVADDVKDGQRENKKVSASGKYFKSGIGFSSKTEMLGFKFLHIDHNKKTYAVEITNVIGDRVVFQFRRFDHSKCGTGKFSDYPEKKSGRHRGDRKHNVVDYREKAR